MKQFNCPDCTKYTNDCYADCERTHKEKYFMASKPSDIGFESHPCTKCPNNPINGGSGICNCTLGQPKITQNIFKNLLTTSFDYAIIRA